MSSILSSSSSGVLTPLVFGSRSDCSLPSWPQPHPRGVPPAPDTPYTAQVETKSDANAYARAMTPPSAAQTISPSSVTLTPIFASYESPLPVLDAVVGGVRSGISNPIRIDSPINGRQPSPTICSSPTAEFVFPEPNLHSHKSSSHSDLHSIVAVGESIQAEPSVQIRPFSSLTGVAIPGIHGVSGHDSPQVPRHSPPPLMPSAAVGGVAGSPEPPSFSLQTAVLGGDVAPSQSPFRSSSFLTDPLASPPPGSSTDDANTVSAADGPDSANAMQWVHTTEHRHRHTDSDEDEDDDEEEESNLPVDLTRLSPTNGALDVEPLGSIGDVSMAVSGSSSGTPSSTAPFYPSMMLPDEFAGGMRMQDVVGESGVGDLDRGESRPRRKKPPPTIATKINLPTTPVTRPKRIQNRRNSEIAPASAAAATRATTAANHMTRHHFTMPAPASILSSDHHQLPAPAFNSSTTMSSIIRPPNCDPSLHRPLISHKRKSVPHDGLFDVDSCEQCSSCADCARHWSSSLGLLKEHVHHDHGHIHSKPTTREHSPATLKLDIQQDEENQQQQQRLHQRNHHQQQFETAEHMVISPAHAQSSTRSHAHTTSNKSHPRNGNTLGNDCCKPNYAVRSCSSISDSDLALSPAFSSRRLHHKMFHGHSYEVDCLLDVRMVDGVVMYKVRWKGYPDLYSSWEPRANLEKNCRDIIEQFEEENGKLDTDEGGDDEDETNEKERTTQLDKEDAPIALSSLQGVGPSSLYGSDPLGVSDDLDLSDPVDHADIDADSTSTSSPRPTNFVRTALRHARPTQTHRIRPTLHAQ